MTSKWSYIQALIYSIVWFVLFGCGVLSPDPTSIHSERELLAIDDRQNAYVLEQKRTLYQVSTEGQILNQYDLSWPLQTFGMLNDLLIYLFNKDFQSLVILDKYLNVLSQMDLSKISDVQIPLVALGNNQSLWLYHPVNKTLQCWSSGLNLLIESQNLDLLIPGHSMDQLIVSGNNIYLVDDAMGIYQFDFTGQWRKTHLSPLIKSPLRFNKVNHAYFKNEKKWFILDLENENPQIDEIQIDASLGETINSTPVVKAEMVFYLKENSLNTIQVQHFNLE